MYCICVFTHNIGTFQFLVENGFYGLFSTLSLWICLMLWLLLSACLFTSCIQQNSRDGLCYLEETNSISIEILFLRLSGMDDLPSYSVVPGWLLLFFTFPDDTDILCSLGFSQALEFAEMLLIYKATISF